MLNLRNNRSALIYGVTAVSLVILGSGIAYYIIEDDKRVKRRREGRKAERTTLTLLQQIKEKAQTIETDIESVENDIENQESTAKEFKQKQYTLAHSNELLLQLMEKLDAIRPLTVILGNGEIHKEPTEFEKNLVSNIKSKKRNVIELIEGLFRRLDVANVKSKNESDRREKEALEKERIEKEEIERKRVEEIERKRIEEIELKRIEEENKLKQELKLKQEKELLEQQLIEQQEALLKEKELQDLEKKASDIKSEQDQVTAQEEAVLAAFKQVEEQDEK